MSDFIYIPEEDLARATPEEREQYRSYLATEAIKLDEWEPWLRAITPSFAVANFGDHHRKIWEWVWSIEKGERPNPLIAVLGRGGAKSSTAEMAIVALAAREKRGYCLYICETQDQADDHVANVAALLESDDVHRGYPELGERMLGKFGSSKGWRRNRIRTATGFTVDAIGLDSAARGVKLENMRPDLMVFDDIDSEQDSPAGVEKKIKTMTRKLIPAGSTDCAVLGIQNLVHDESIFARLVDGRADFLRDRILIGPIPAIWNFEYVDNGERFEIVGGEASWEGQPIETAEGLLNDIGLTAFLSECQHSTVPPAGEMFDHINWANLHVTEAQLPAMKRVVVWCDPAVTATDRSDSQAIQCDGLGADDLYYRLFSWEGRTTPLDAIKRAIRAAIEWGAETVGVETDQGGDTWESVYWQACEELREELGPDGQSILSGPAPKFDSEKAGAGYGSKTSRAQEMLVDYERHRFRHLVGTHSALELALRRFPKSKPFDLVDAAGWSWRDLAKNRRKKKATIRTAASRSVAYSTN